MTLTLVYHSCGMRKQSRSRETKRKWLLPQKKPGKYEQEKNQGEAKNVKPKTKEKEQPSPIKISFQKFQKKKKIQIELRFLRSTQSLWVSA